MTAREFIKASSSLGAGIFIAKKHFANLEGPVQELFTTKLVPKHSSLDEDTTVIVVAHTGDVQLPMVTGDVQVSVVEGQVDHATVNADIVNTGATVEIELRK